MVTILLERYAVSNFLHSTIANDAINVLVLALVIISRCQNVGEYLGGQVLVAKYR